MDPGRAVRSRDCWCLRCGHLRRRTQRLRVLPACHRCTNRQGDGRCRAAARQGIGQPRLGQGNVSDSVIVQKYGGTSVGSAARIRRVSRRIAATVNKGEQVVAVVSAMGHTTDRLIALAQSVNPEPSARELDMLVANGETITAPLVAMCL
ncbi:MAG TPA: hypothetical protein DCK98_02890, partial [Chloroflexi bacterium]|nr:hypothetical protein [Chloroflexota bacterium]